MRVVRIGEIIATKANMVVIEIVKSISGILGIIVSPFFIVVQHGSADITSIGEIKGKIKKGVKVCGGSISNLHYSVAGSYSCNVNDDECPFTIH